MRLITLGILGGVAAVAAIAAVTLVPTGENPDAKLGERMFPELAAKSEDVRSIELQRPEGTIAIARDGDAWRVPAKLGYPADSAKVRQLFVEVTALRTLEAKTRNRDLYASLEVEDRDQKDAKSTRVAFKNAQGQDILALLAGKNRYGRGGGGDDAVYVRKAGDAQAWLARGRLTVNRETVHWLDREITNVARDRVHEAVVRHADGTVVTVRRASPGDRDFAVADVPEGRKAKSSWEINSVAGAFEKLELDDVRKAGEATIAADGPSAMVTTYDGLAVTARFGEADGATWVAITATAAPPATLPEGISGLKKPDEVKAEADAINRRVGPWLYKLPSFNLDNMRRKLEDLLEPKSS
ncbi:MAG: DUF4340 domain-containing protein [Alphaproteobacteria bacterium]|nr:DUF4340 domain-containing protein [Alphaproteobacteria bacterium]